jgi:hypothetical protein
VSGVGLSYLQSSRISNCMINENECGVTQQTSTWMLDKFDESMLFPLAAPLQVYASIFPAEG